MIEPPHLPEVLQPLGDLIAIVMNQIKLLVGGLFGLYVIFFIIRFFYERKNRQILMQIKHDLDRIKKRMPSLKKRNNKAKSASKKKKR